MLTRAHAEAMAAGVPAVPYVAGRWHSGHGLRTFDVTDPVTERPLAAVAEAAADTVDAAVSAACDALADGDWGRMDGAARGMLLGRLADLLDTRREDFAVLESLEIGKPGFEPRMIDLPQASPLDPSLPWGGSGLSGHGRELGWPGLEANTEEKTITIIL